MLTASDIMVNFGTAAIYRELKHVRIVNSLSITVNIRADSNINHIIVTF